MYPAEERREKGGTERERERRRRVVVKRWQCYHHQYVSRDTYRSRYTIYIYIYIRGLQTNEKVFTTGPALIISLALSFRGVRTHVSFLISAAISPSNDRPYKLQLLSSTSETPPPPPQEGRKERRKEQEAAAALPSSFQFHFASSLSRRRCIIRSPPPISFELKFSRATRFFKGTRGQRSRSSLFGRWHLDLGGRKKERKEED